MDTLSFFQLKRESLCQGVHQMLAAQETVLRARPHGLNSIAWLLWHVSRCEDVGVNRLVTEGVQVFDTDGWPERLHVLRRDIGTGMTDKEVTELGEQIDLPALDSYWTAVTARTAEVVATLDPSTLDAPVSDANIHQLIVEEGVFDPRAVDQGYEEFWTKQPNRGWFLAQLALTHSFGHLYAAQVVRSLLPE